MSETSREQEKYVAHRPELGRLRAVGGVSERVIVDGVSIQRWCTRTGWTPAQLAAEMITAADVGRRQLLFVVSPLMALGAIKTPHVSIPFEHGAMTALWSAAFAHFEGSRIPTILVAYVDEYDEELFGGLEYPEATLLDFATGKLWTDADFDETKFGRSDAASTGNLHANDPAGAQLVAALSAPSQSTGLFVTASWRRGKDYQVELREVAIDDGAVRTIVHGHKHALALVTATLEKNKSQSPNRVPVMTSAMEILDAMHAAGATLPAAVKDPALACVVLNPDARAAPDGVGGMWRRVLGRRPDDGIALDVRRALDELPGLQAELDALVALEGLTALYEDDVSRTLPVFAAMETRGFRVTLGVTLDLGSCLRQMEHDFRQLQANAGLLAQADLLTASQEEIGKLLRKDCGALPPSLRAGPPTLDRYALTGNKLAQEIQALRANQSVLQWLERIKGTPRVRSITEPGSTGRWYPHGNPVTSIPKYPPLAPLLRKHLAGWSDAVVLGDYEAYEPRLLAAQSNDQVLVSAANAPGDFYDALRVNLPGQVARDAMKAALLAFVYGQTAGTFVESLPLPIYEGYAIYNALRTTLSVADTYKRQIQGNQTAVAHEPLGGWRRLRARADTLPTFRRRAFSLNIQGAGATIMRRLLRRLNDALPREAHVLHQEFDAVIVGCRRGQIASVSALLKHEMENIVRLPHGVPLRARIKTGTTLADVT